MPNPTKLSEFSGYLPRHQAQPIFERTARRSVVQQLARQIPLSYNGESVPVVTGKLTAGWVSEGGLKPTSSGALGLAVMDPKKLSVISVVSSEVVRANPGNYMGIIRNQIAEAFAIAFDRAALYDQAPDGTAGGGPFATSIGQTTNTVELGTGTDIHGDLVAGLQAVLDDGYRITGWAFDDKVEPMFLSARDGNDRPLYMDLATGATTLPEVGETRAGRLLGRASFMGGGIYSGDATDMAGVGGQWDQCIWGSVGGISYSVSTETAVTIGGTLTSLWEHNLVAVRAEAEYGFLVADANAFVTFSNGTP